MKIVALLGSPRRKGNSSGLCEKIIDVLSGNADDVVIHYLNSLKYRGCQACEGCKTRSEFCVLLDDLTPVLKDVREADITIFASPVYWGDVSAQLKGFIDRTYSYLTPDFTSGPVRHRLRPGKKLIFILTQGGDAAMYGDIYKRYSAFYKELDLFSEIIPLRGCDLSERDDFMNNPDLLQKAEDIATRILDDNQ